MECGNLIVFRGPAFVYPPPPSAIPPHCQSGRSARTRSTQTITWKVQSSDTTPLSVMGFPITEVCPEPGREGDNSLSVGVEGIISLPGICSPASAEEQEELPPSLPDETGEAEEEG